MSRELKLTSFRLALTGIAGVKVCCTENKTQAVGGLSNHEEMYGKELEKQHQSPVKSKGCLNSNVSNIYCGLRPGHN
jgi:hypothetical protein